MTTNYYDIDLHHLEACTELRLGLPSPPIAAAARGVKRHSPEILETKPTQQQQVVGWPPVRSYRKSCMDQKRTKNVGEDAEEVSVISLVKVSMDGAPYLRKIDLKFYKDYPDLVKALETMFECKIGCLHDESEYATTYEDKDGDWMLAGDVPWEMFICSCKRIRVMKGSQTKGLESNAIQLK